MAKPILAPPKNQKRSNISLSIKIITILTTIALFGVALGVSVSNSFVVIFSNYEHDAWLFSLALGALALGEVAAIIANGTKKEIAKDLYDRGKIVSMICFAMTLAALAILPSSFMMGRQSILWILLIASVVQLISIIAGRKKGVNSSAIVSLAALAFAGAQTVFLPLIFGTRGEEYLLAIPIGFIAIPIAAKIYDKNKRKRLGTAACVVAAVICMIVAAASAFCYYSTYINMHCYESGRPSFSWQKSNSGYFVPSSYIDEMERFRFCSNFR